MRALLAFDKFKDAISAREACAVTAAALREVQPTWECDLCPLTDGGEGFVEILTHAAKGQIKTAEVTGPRGKPVTAAFGLVPLKNIPPAAQQRLALPAEIGGDALVAIIEMAAASGLALLSSTERDPWQTSTLGTGELMRIAAEMNAQAIVLGIGGSATNDLGLGALAALGFEFFSAHAEKIFPPIPANWASITRITDKLPHPFPPIRVACDVTNPLLGPNGCAAIYGAQKGLRRDDLPTIEDSSVRLAQLLCTQCGRPSAIMDTPGAGAAGGIAFGLMTAADARLLSGFALTADWFELAERIRSADVVLTGEGRFDDSSAQGKGPGAILALAVAANRPAHIFAGQISTNAECSAALHPITPGDWPLEQALRATPDLLRSAVQRSFR